MDEATARERIFRLEEDRDLLLDAWKALDTLDRNAATECHRITRAPEFARTFQRIQEHLTALDEEQSALIAGLQDADAGWKGGSVHAFAFKLLQRQTWRRVPRVGAALHERVARHAAEMGVSVRQVIEAALAQYLGTRKRADLPPKPCERCGRSFARRPNEPTGGYRRRRFCGLTCFGISNMQKLHDYLPDAEILAAVARHGIPGAAKQLGYSTRRVRDRLKAIHERERKAA